MTETGPLVVVFKGLGGEKVQNRSCVGFTYLFLKSWTVSSIRRASSRLSSLTS